MIIHDIIKKEADEYFNKISVNDFYSFTKSDFKNNVLIDLSHEKAIEDARESDLLIKKITDIKNTLNLTMEENVFAEAIIDFCNYIKINSKFYWFKFNLTHNTSPLPYIIKALQLYPSSNKSELENYIELLMQLPKALKDMREKLKKQKEMGIVLPMEQCEISINMLKSCFQDHDSKLYRQSYTEKISKLINEYNEEINLTIDYLKSDYVIENTYKPTLCNHPDGQEYYNSLIKIYTSYDSSPEKIHQIGLESIEKTRKKMREVIKSLGYQMSIEEFNKHIESDPRFFDRTPEDLYNRMNGFLEKIRPYLKHYFKRLPICECEVKRIDPSREASTSWGYYAVPTGIEKKGIYYFSGAELDKRCQIRAGAIVYHELLPGHHFQMSLIAEDKMLPKICNQHFNTAYADGWAEYSADLANEIGMFDEYDLYGRYLWDLILSTRLVVDTGVNALGWSLMDAQDFMKKNTTLTDKEILTESLRYSVDMPGQALAYKIGSLKMHELRTKAEGGLKNKFNIKEYHDVVMKYGSIPLYIVEKNVDRYITGKQILDAYNCKA